MVLWFGLQTFVESLRSRSRVECESNGHCLLRDPLLSSEDWNTHRYLFMFINIRFTRHSFFVSEFYSSGSAPKEAFVCSLLPSSPPEDLWCEGDGELMK